jgi:hypothetical protein
MILIPYRLSELKISVETLTLIEVQCFANPPMYAFSAVVSTAVFSERSRIQPSGLNRLPENGLKRGKR